MLVSREDCLAELRCPVTGLPLGRQGDALTTGEGRDYPIVNGVPVLVDFERSVLDRERTLSAASRSLVERDPYAGRFAPLKRLISPEKASTQQNVERMIEALLDRSPAPRVLVVGGGTIGQGMDRLYRHPDIRLYAFDIYASSNVQCVADAHNMPFADGALDGVVIQAVLEHVLSPREVVAEIERVLAPGGLVYAETPFMQQVHEGPFDFSRFTDSGHRSLFAAFETIASGSSGGPGTVFMWSVDYLARGLFRSATAGKVAKLGVFWAQYLDRLIPEPYAIDGASGVFFLGHKTGRSAGPLEIVGHYKGAQ